MRTVARSHDIAERDGRTDDSAPVQTSLFDAPPRHPVTVTKNLSALGQSWEHANLHAEVITHPTADIRGMVRGDSPTTSQAAATRILPKLSVVEAIVLDLIRKRPSTAGELEVLPCFVGLCARNTVRTTVSRLTRAGARWKEPLLVDSGENRGGMAVWRVAP